eukprot:1161349-Rhodomonas_salina.1
MSTARSRRLCTARMMRAVGLMVWRTGGGAPDAIVEKEVAGEGEAYPDGHPGKAGGSQTSLALAADILADTERTTG